MSRSQSSSKLIAANMAEEVAEYTKRLSEGLNLEQKTVSPNFGLLPTVPLLNKYKKIYYQIIQNVRSAIIEGNINKLQVYLGPALYQRHKRDNRQIHQLRWEWITAQEKMDSYAQLFDLALWYARKLACDEYIAMGQRTLKDEMRYPGVKVWSEEGF